MTNEEKHQEEVHLIDYIYVLLQRRRTFLLTFCTVVVAVILYTVISTPVYRAESLFHLEDDKSRQGLFGELLMSNIMPIQSEIEIIRSRTVSEETVRRLHLDWNVSKKTEGLSFRIVEFSAPQEEPSFSLFPRKKYFTITMTAPEHYRVADASGTLIGEGKAGEILRTERLKLLLADLKGKPGDSFRLTLLPFNDVVRDLKKAVKASELKAKTNILQLSYESPDPEKARDVVNTMGQTYLEKRISSNNEVASKTLDFIGEQFGGVQKELDESEKKLQDYKKKSGVVDLDAEAKLLLSKIADTEKLKAEALIQKKQNEFAVSAMKDALAKGRDYSPSFMKSDTDPNIAGLAAKLSDLEIQKRALLTEYTEAYPAVIEIKEKIAEVQKKILTTYETGIRNIERNENSFSGLIGSYERELNKQPAAQRELASLMRYTKVNSDIYTLLLQKREEARIAKASTISKMSIVDPAITPDRPVKPEKARNIFLGLIVGLMTGIFVAFFQDYLDDTVKDAETAKKKLGVPLLATIPYISGKKNGDEGQKRKPDKEEVVDAVGHIRETLITHLEPKSPVSEAFRNLRTSIRFSLAIKKAKVIMLSSSFQGEGKSTISANLAIAIAQSGSRILLVDCDLRRPSLHRVFGHSMSPGLTDIIAGDITLESAVHKLNIDNLSLITAGPLPPNPSELLGADKMRSLVDEAKGLFDIVILDAPPVLPVTDARLLTVLSDMTVLVVEAGRVPRKALEEVKERMGQSLNAFIMNDKRKEHFARHYGYYRYNHYGYYDEDKNNTGPWWKRFF